MNDLTRNDRNSHASEQLSRALRRAALLYHSFAETLIRELGEEKGRELTRLAIDAYGTHIGRESRERAREKGLETSPENYQDDLPETAWKTETVVVDGEERVRVHHCPLAAEWMEWGDPELARIYCFVDQAKMRAFNPDFEYVHVRNLLDGDPFCELAVRPVASGTKKESGPSSGPDGRETVHWVGGRYTREDLYKMDPVCLRALFRERIHHTIEVKLRPILNREEEPPEDFGRQPRLILEVWRERGLSEEGDDFDWGKRHLELAERISRGEEVSLNEPLPHPFTEQEAAVVERLFRSRRSIRNWVPGRPIPDALIDRLLEAGRAAPTGCNLDIVRFAVIRRPEEAAMLWSDIPTPMDRCVLIVIGFDRRVYETVGHDRIVPHNRLFDCAAAADHICLMAHTLGLGACWLTRTEKTGREFKRRYGLPDYIEPALHIAVGWPEAGTIKSGRLPLSDMRINARSGRANGPGEESDA